LKEDLHFGGNCHADIDPQLFGVIVIGGEEERLWQYQILFICPSAERAKQLFKDTCIPEIISDK
jgi:hypothetical protein